MTKSVRNVGMMLGTVMSVSYTHLGDRVEPDFCVDVGNVRLIVICKIRIVHCRELHAVLHLCNGILLARVAKMCIRDS